jgi:hypothetical protein
LKTRVLACRMPRVLLMAYALLLAAAAQGAPMGFRDSTMAMGDFGRHWRELTVNRAFTARDAAGLAVVSMRSDDGRRSREMAEGTYTRLLRRWNMEHAQANAWFVGGVGAVRGNDFGDTRTLIAPGMQIDYETTRLYFAGLARLYRARGLNHDFGAARAGFSLYEVEYEETQPWIVVEARHMRGLSRGVEITPMLRMINKSWFLEAGVNTEGRPRLNFMYIF